MRPSLGFRRTKNAFRELKPNKAILGYSEHKETFCFCVWGDGGQGNTSSCLNVNKGISKSSELVQRHF